MRSAAALVRSAYWPLVSSKISGCSGQAPAQLAGLGHRRLDLGAPLVVVGEHARVGGPERHDDRAGQRGQVDDALGALLDRVGQGVGQDQPALGVGVVDLDGLAVHRGDDVAGLDRAAARHVLGGRHHGGDAHGKPELGDGGHRLQHGGPAGHVELHLVHLRRGLDGDPAGVEGHGLADEAQVGPRRRRRRSAARSGAARRRCPGPRRRRRPCPGTRSPRRRAAPPPATRARRRSPWRARPGRSAWRRWRAGSAGRGRGSGPRRSTRAALHLRLVSRSPPRDSTPPSSSSRSRT